MSLTLDSERPDGVPVESDPRARSLKFFVAGVLVLGGTAGLVFNRTASGPLPVQAASETETAPVAAPETAPEETVSPQGGPSAGAGVAAKMVDPLLASIRMIEVEVPEDPFRPSTAPAPRGVPVVPPAMVSPPAPMVVAPRLARPPVLPPATGFQAQDPNSSRLTVRAVVPRASVAPARPSPEELTLTGIIQGDPPLAVVRSNGQSFYLKIGEQVADTWRLVEIKERSAMFRLGERRVEIPIIGGSSE